MPKVLAPTTLAILLGILSAAGCSRHAPRDRRPETVDRSPVTTAPDSSDAAETADAASEVDIDAGQHDVLTGYPEELELDEGGDPLGVVGVPLGAREPRPVMIALHGGSERPSRACAAWRAVTEGYPFVACPRGWGGNAARLGWRNVTDTRQRIDRILRAVRATFGPWVKETSSFVLVGFSMGGSQVALVARADPKTYRRIVVGDSAHDPRSALTFSRAWVGGGGERAVFLCTTSGCEPAMRRAARSVAAAKASSRLNIAPTQVHALAATAARSMRRDWPWLVEGAEGWESYSPAADPSLGGKTEAFEPN